MKIKSTVQVKDRWPIVGRQAESAVIRSLLVAGRAGAAHSAQVAGQRRRSGAMADIKTFPPIPIVKGGGFGRAHGWDVGWVSNPFYSLFQEFGTNSSRRRRLSKATLARQASPSGQARQAGQSRGIKPLYFMGKGRTLGRRLLRDALIREFRDIK